MTKKPKSNPKGESSRPKATHKHQKKYAKSRVEGEKLIKSLLHRHRAEINASANMLEKDIDRMIRVKLKEVKK